MATPDKSRELELVTKVDFQIAYANTDSKLENLLNKYLAPLLLKLASPHVEVRTQVIKTCEHVNVRVRGAPALQLPVAALLQQFRDVDNSLVRHLDLQYIKMGIDRVPVNERLEMLPVILKGLSDVHVRSSQHSSTLFGLFIRLIPHVRLPPRGGADDMKMRTQYDLSSSDSEFLASWLGKLLLYQGPSDRGAGLTTADVEFLDFDFWSIPGRVEGSINLGEVKILATKFLVSGLFSESERFIPALIASADANSRISEVGQDMLKRALPAADLENPELVDRLFKLYIGSPPEVIPAKFPLKQRLLSVLSKSIEATKHKESQAVIKDAIEPSTYGLEENKLKAEAFAFVIWITRVGGEHMDSEGLINEIKALIHGQGWPKADLSGNSRFDKAILDARARAYETIGLLLKSDAKRKSSSTNLRPAALVQWLFSSLAEDSSGQIVTMGIESAISNAIVAVSAKSPTKDEETELFSILTDCVRGMQVGDPDARSLASRIAYPALRFANKCFSFDRERARLLNMLALSEPSPRHELTEEAKNGLDPYLQSLNYQADNPDSAASQIQLPNLSSLVKAIFGTRENPNKIHLSRKAMAEAVVLCKNVLFHEALKSGYRPPVIDQHWAQNIEAATRNDEPAIKAVRNDLSERFSETIDEFNPLDILIEQAFEVVVKEGSQDASGEALLALLAFSPTKTILNISGQTSKLQQRIISNEPFSRNIAAQTFGILRAVQSVASGDWPASRKDADSLFLTYNNSFRGVGAEINKAAGALSSLSHWLGRLRPMLDESGSDFGLPSDLSKLILSYNLVFSEKLDKTLQEAAAGGLCQLALFGLQDEQILSILDEKNTEALSNLKKLALAGNEVAVTAIGYLSLAVMEDLEDDSKLKKLAEMAYDLHETRQAELHFAVGSALSIMAFGRESKALVGKIDLVGPDFVRLPRDKAAAFIMDKVLKACKNTKPALRQASAIWLLCLVRDGGHLDFVKQQLPTCQVAFKSLLGDKDSLNQETGSMGLGMVYEQGGKDLKGDLIKDLIGTFTETKSSLSGGNVSEDTQLFEAGALPTEGGQSVTTYKDIINLANEVGDPGLVYRFMSLAANSSIWSSRAAFGRFGLSRVLSDASVDGYLASNPKLYSSLYRYRFDPNPNVQRAMNDIWIALVKDPQKTIDENFDHIMTDLLKSIVTKEWRTRQASCAALSDLVQGRQLQKYEKYLNELWTQTFKVCDDIKGSVRTAAMALARVLTNVVTRTLEGGEASANTAHAMLKQVVPFLLGSSGIEATAKESQAFALLTILDIIKKSTATVLRPYIPELVSRLLPLLSSLEPEAANYLHLNADKYKITTQDLDDIRTSAVKASPMMEAIERCLDKLDEDSMKALIPNLAETAKTVIGLPSRIGVARVLISLATRRNFLFKPYAAQFIIILRNKHIVDRNDTVSTSAAAACGYLARLAEDKDILKLVEWSKTRYFGEEEERYRVIAGELIHALAKYATDRFTALSSSILPFVYLAKHDTHEAAAEVFKSAWEESVSGNRAVLLHLKEIIALSNEHLESPRWAIKHASALTVADTVRAAAGPEIAESDARTIWPAMEKAMAAKTWSGKEKVLEALVLLTEKSKLMTKDHKIASQIRTIFIREAKRQNETYRPHALHALSSFIEFAREMDYFETVSPLIDSVLEQLEENSGEDAMDVDSKKAGGASAKIVAHNTMANAIKLLITSLDPKHREGPTLKTDLESCLEASKKGLKERDRGINEAILDAMKGLFGRLRGSDNNGVKAVLAEFAAFVTEFGDSPEQTREKAAEAAQALAGLELGEVNAVLSKKAQELAETERTESIRRKWLALVG